MQPEFPSAPALADALIVDPFYLAISVDFEHDMPARKAVLADYFAYSLGEAARTGRFLAAEDARLGAAAWLLPRTEAVDATESVAKSDYLAGALGPRGHDNYRRIVDFMAARSPAVVPAHAWYLSILGISPDAQGRGLGAQLLAPRWPRPTRRACPASWKPSRRAAWPSTNGWASVARRNTWSRSRARPT